MIVDIHKNNDRLYLDWRKEMHIVVASFQVFASNTLSRKVSFTRCVYKYRKCSMPKRADKTFC